MIVAYSGNSSGRFEGPCYTCL